MAKEDTTVQMTTIQEGKATVSSPNAVFYNPVQQFNRDLSVLVIDTFLKNELWKKNSHKLPVNCFQICEALSATGLRCIRYALELENKDKIVKFIANDISPDAAEVIKKNVEANKCEKIEVKNEDASLLLMKRREHWQKYLIIDIDPYGTASPFIDSAVQAICDGGLLMATCTDVAILCGNASESCFAKYGSVSLRSDCCHEMALRILLRLIESCATRYGKYIAPLVSVSVDFYIRVFVQVFQSPSHAKFSASKQGMVYMCNGCESFNFQKLGEYTVKNPNSTNIAVKCRFFPATGPSIPQSCEICGSSFNVGGPIYLDPIHSTEFLEMLKNRLIELDSKNLTENFGTFKRMQGMINVISEELIDTPLFYCSDRFAQKIRGISPPSHLLRSAILNGGYRVSISHCNPISIKTNAPNHVLWDIFREWSRNHSTPIIEKLKDGELAKIILQKPSTSVISFSIHPEANPPSKDQKLLRFQVNPPFWGPKSRAKPEKSNDQTQSNQDKKMKTDEVKDKV